MPSIALYSKELFAFTDSNALVRTFLFCFMADFAADSLLEAFCALPSFSSLYAAFSAEAASWLFYRAYYEAAAADAFAASALCFLFRISFSAFTLEASGSGFSIPFSFCCTFSSEPSSDFSIFSF